MLAGHSAPHVEELSEGWVPALGSAYVAAHLLRLHLKDKHFTGKWTWRQRAGSWQDRPAVCLWPVLLLPVFQQMCSSWAELGYEQQGLCRPKSATSCASNREDLMYAGTANEYKTFLLTGALQNICFWKESLSEGKVVFPVVTTCLHGSVSEAESQIVRFQHALLDQHRQVMFLISVLLQCYQKRSVSVNVLVSVLVTCSISRW